MAAAIHLMWDSLVVADTSARVFEGTKVSKFNKDKWKPTGVIFRFVTCARQTMTTVEKSKLPETWQTRSDVNLYQGPQAYRFLLSYLTGLDACNRQPGRIYPDIHASGDMRRAWTSYRAENPKKSRGLIPLIEAAFHDGNLIKKSVLSHIETHPTLSNAAVELADLKAKKTALVVGDDPEKTLHLITAMGHGKIHHPSKITVMMRNDDALSKLQQSLSSLPAHRKVTVPIEFANSNDQPPASSALLVSAPQKGHEDAFAAWWGSKQPAQADTKVYLTDSTNTAGQEKGAHFSLENVQQRQKAAIEIIERIKAGAFEAINRIVELRSHGDRVLAINFNPQLADSNYVIARRPKGPPNDSPADSALHPQG